MRKVFICLISWTNRVKRNGSKRSMRWLLKMNQKVSNALLIGSYSVEKRKNGGIEFLEKLLQLVNLAIRIDQLS